MWYSRLVYFERSHAHAAQGRKRRCDSFQGMQGGRTISATEAPPLRLHTDFMPHAPHRPLAIFGCPQRGTGHPLPDPHRPSQKTPLFLHRIYPEALPGAYQNNEQSDNSPQSTHPSNTSYRHRGSSPLQAYFTTSESKASMCHTLRRCLPVLRRYPGGGTIRAFPRAATVPFARAPRTAQT